MLESSYGFFQRGIPLPEGVKTDRITGNYENGTGCWKWWLPVRPS